MKKSYEIASKRFDKIRSYTNTLIIFVFYRLYHLLLTPVTTFRGGL